MLLYFKEINAILLCVCIKHVPNQAGCRIKYKQLYHTSMPHRNMITKSNSNPSPHPDPKRLRYQYIWSNSTTNSRPRTVESHM